ncbi:hypothetical protein ACFYY8_33420 [Streptosporangium sp. NPDC001559]|uniref:hypothetical protein n=1 Tax=Streptosporangium sp. NPDC001559 TaxID=3366187 RepID=UPI0036EEFA38
MSPQQRRDAVERALATKAADITKTVTKSVAATTARTTMCAPKPAFTTSGCTCDNCTTGGKK